MSILRTFRILKAVASAKPVLVINLSGQRTNQPKVTLSLYSERGMISLYTREDTDVGDAQIQMYSQTVSHISGLPVADNRPNRIWQKSNSNSQGGYWMQYATIE